MQNRYKYDINVLDRKNERQMMSSFVVLGSNGFLGRAFIANHNHLKPIKAVVRDIPTDADVTQKGVTWVEADLMDPTSLYSVLSEGDVLINLAYMSNVGETENIGLVDNIIRACIRSKVARLVHCSTAVVVGNSKALRVDESSPCTPITPYEQTKWALEQRLLNALPIGLDIGILRPTAIVGPGGKNLLKLAEALKNGNQIVNYLKVCLLGMRPMHLVPVRNVVAALLHLAVCPSALEGNIYIVSSDEDPDNNFLRVEAILMETIGIGSRKLLPVTLPKILQSLLFRLMGLTDINLHRVYDSGKLHANSYKSVDSVADAIRGFAESLRLD